MIIETEIISDGECFEIKQSFGKFKNGDVVKVNDFEKIIIGEIVNFRSNFNDLRIKTDFGIEIFSVTDLIDFA